MARISALTPKIVTLKTKDCDVVIPLNVADGLNYRNMFLFDKARVAKERLTVLMDLMCAAYKKGFEDGRKESAAK